jgi:putative DNA primase/helicase
MTQHDVRAAFDAAEEIDAAPVNMAEIEAMPVEARPVEYEGAKLPLNDFGNGQRLNLYIGQDLLFVPRLGWFSWDGQRWHPDEDEILARRSAQKVAAYIEREAIYLELTTTETAALKRYQDAKAELARLKKAGLEKSDDALQARSAINDCEGLAKSVAARRAQYFAWSRTSGNTSRISAMLLESSVNIIAPIEALNANPLMLNTTSGTLNFCRTRAGYDLEVLPHNRDHLISKVCAAAYDPTAECPNFKLFLAQIQPEGDMRDFLQRWFGYALTGLTTEQKMTFFFGGGRNGKSTLVDLIAKLMADYATSVPIESLTGTEQRKGSDATPDLVRVPGARFIRTSEPEQGQRMKEALIKQLTGGEPINIRRMHKEFVEVMPEFKLTISGNHRPEIRGSDDGIWRRVLLVPFNEQIAKGDVDPALPAKLWAERDGILNWLIEGALAYLETGLAIPESVTAATDLYRLSSDPVREFLLTEMEITGDAGDWISSREIIEYFNCWQYARGETVFGRRTAGNKFTHHAEALTSATGKKFDAKKRSNAGYSGLIAPQGLLETYAAHIDLVRDLMRRKG